MRHDPMRDVRLLAAASGPRTGNTWGWGHAGTYALHAAARRAGAASDTAQARHGDLTSQISDANARGALALARMLAGRLPASARECYRAEAEADQARLELRVHLCTHDPIRWAGVPQTVTP